MIEREERRRLQAFPQPVRSSPCEKEYLWKLGACSCVESIRHAHAHDPQRMSSYLRLMSGVGKVGEKLKLSCMVLLMKM